jgi:hypothetical protein
MPAWMTAAAGGFAGAPQPGLEAQVMAGAGGNAAPPAWAGVNMGGGGAYGGAPQAGGYMPPNRSRSRSRERSGAGGGALLGYGGAVGGGAGGGGYGGPPPAVAGNINPVLAAALMKTGLAPGGASTAGAYANSAGPGVVNYNSAAMARGGGGGGGGGGGAPPQQATRVFRRLYVGNIPIGIQSSEMIHIFNEIFNASGYPGDHLVNFNVMTDKPFGFAEFRTMEAAEAAISLDGLNVRGKGIRVTRPNDYRADIRPPLQGAPMRLTLPPGSGGPGPAGLNVFGGAPPGPGAVATGVPDGPNKICIGGLPSGLSDADFKSLLANFGAVRAFHLTKDGTGIAFAQFEDAAGCDAAVLTLHGLEMNGAVVRHAWGFV